MTSQKMKEIADECKQSIHQREPIVHMTHLMGNKHHNGKNTSAE